MYPQNLDRFIEKLNKIDNNTYVIEEEVTLENGVYEGYLDHDNVSVSSVNVYSGKKLTGEKINNFILSTPSKTPWKKIIKVFSTTYDTLYITYETQGDTVEAEDINSIQDSIVRTQTEVDRYKKENDIEVNDLKERTTNLEIVKADKTYVDTELNKKYNKSEVYTKSETDSRIQEVVGAAPEALDTLKEIAESLNNDSDFAGTMTKELSKKVDKVEGKQLSTEDYTTLEKNKLLGIEEGANKYIHPSTHNASMITEDSTHRFITDTERSNWNDANNKKHTHSNKSILDIITQTLINSWNSAYSHISDAIKHITSDERTLWNTVSNKVDKITGKGLSTNDFTSAYKSKLDGITSDATKVQKSNTNGNVLINGTETPVYTHPSGTNPHGTTKSDVGLGNVTNDSQVKRSEMGVVGGVATLDSKGVNVQAPKAHTHDDRYYTETEANNKFVTKAELGDSGYGDMTKAVYDTNNNGIVDKAEAVEWSGVLNKPSSFTPASHTHMSLSATSLSGQTVSLNTLNLASGSPQVAHYYCPTDNAGANITGRPNDSTKNAFSLKVELIRWASEKDYISKQTYVRGIEGVIYVRYCNSGTWSSWEKVYTSRNKPTPADIGAMKKGPLTWNDLKGV